MVNASGSSKAGQAFLYFTPLPALVFLMLPTG